MDLYNEWKPALLQLAVCAPGSWYRAQLQMGPRRGSSQGCKDRLKGTPSPQVTTEGVSSLLQGECSLLQRLQSWESTTCQSPSLSKQRHRRTKLWVFIWAKMHLETMNNEEEMGRRRRGGVWRKRKAAQMLIQQRKTTWDQIFPKGSRLSDMTLHLSKRKFLGL